MSTGPRSLLILLAVLPSLGASYRTDNFHVEAPTAGIAEQVALEAERHRKDQALAWLGQEMPAWTMPCSVHVTITLGVARGCTTLRFDRGQVTSRSMTLEGPLDRLLASVLPHETTHTIFGHYFGRPLPRWADEGGAALTETVRDRDRRADLCREIMSTPGRAIPLRRLLLLREYPDDFTALYAQGASLVQFLVAAGGRPRFLAFVAQGMQRNDWETAVQAHYGFRSVEDLERAWQRPRANLGWSALAAVSLRAVTHMIGDTGVPLRGVSQQYLGALLRPDDFRERMRLAMATDVNRRASR